MSQNTNNQRITFATSKALLDYPDFLEWGEDDSATPKRSNFPAEAI